MLEPHVPGDGMSIGCSVWDKTERFHGWEIIRCAQTVPEREHGNTERRKEMPSLEYERCHAAQHSIYLV